MDRVSQASIEQEVGARLLERYYASFTWPLIYAEILLWSNDNREHYVDDTTGSRQAQDMYAAVAVRLERAKAKKDGYSVDDLAWYSIGELKELAEQVCSGHNSTRLNSSYVDAAHGIYVLLPAQARNIILGYHLGWVHDEDAYESAIRGLQRVLGDQKPEGL